MKIYTDHKSIEDLLDSIEANCYSFDLGSRTYPLEYAHEWVQLRRQIIELDAKNIARIAELERFVQRLSTQYAEDQQNPMAF